MEDKKISQSSDQKMKVKLDGGASVNVMLTSVYRKPNPKMSYDDGIPWLEKFDKDWTNQV